MELDADAVQLAKDLVQIAFFIVAGTVAVVTYLQARKTVLQPIKTESFKCQVRLLEKISGLVGGQTETELCESFGLRLLVVANAVKLLDDFSQDHGGEKVDVDSRPYSDSRCPSYQINLKSGHAQDFILLRGPLDEMRAQAQADRGARVRDWANFVWEEIRLPKEFQEAVDNVGALRKSPFLADEIGSLLGAFIDTLWENVDGLKMTLEECGRELHRLRTETSGRVHTGWSWIHTRFGGHSTPLKPAATALADGIKKYLKTNEIMK